VRSDLLTPSSGMRVRRRGDGGGVCAQVGRVGAAADTFGGMHSDLPEPERPDRGRLAEDLCDVLIQMVRRGCWPGWGVGGAVPGERGRGAGPQAAAACTRTGISG
jgi:hypothetical protein